MNCQEVMELMQRQLDDDLTENEMVVLMNHTRQCPDCAAMFERLQHVSAELASLPKVTPSYSLVDAIMPQLERIERSGEQEAAAKQAARLLASESLPSRSKQRRRWPSMRVMSGVIAAGIVAGLFLVTYRPGESPSFNKLNDMFTADEASTAADTAAGNAPEAYSMTAPAQARTNKPEVGTQTMANDNGQSQEAEQEMTEASSMNAPDSAVKEDASANLKEQSTADGGTGQHLEPTVEDSYGLTGKNGEYSVSGSTENNEGASEEDNQKGLSAAELSITSPDGLYLAISEDFMVKIYAAADQKLVQQSTRKNGSVANLTWAEDSQSLTYEVHVEKGAIEKFVFNIETGEERKAEH